MSFVLFVQMSLGTIAAVFVLLGFGAMREGWASADEARWSASAAFLAQATAFFALAILLTLGLIAARLFFPS